MKYTFALPRGLKRHLVLVCGFTLLFAFFAHGQLTDDVHIVPRKVSIQPDPISASVPDGPASIPHSKPLRVDVNLVLVPVNVSDSMNRPVVSLKKEDFALYDEDQRQEIQYFSAEQSPMSVAILVDVSKSMRQRVDIERAAIAEFFKNANPDDEYFAITFSDHPRLLASSMQSIDEIEQKLEMVTPGGPTAMLDAIYLAESQLRNARYKRKAIVILSDGGDNASRYTLREVKDLIQESDVQIYAIGLFETFFFNALESRMGKKWLSEITDATGGRTITVENKAKLPEAAAEISRELRNQYVLGYRAPNSTASRWRKIKIRVTTPATESPTRAYYKQGYLTAE